MEILELKKGSIDVNSIGIYNALKNKLDFITDRLNCVTSPEFKCNYFRLGDYGNGVYDYGDTVFENKHYIILSDNRSDLDGKLKQDIIDFLTVKLMEQKNEVITQMNNLIKG